LNSILKDLGANITPDVCIDAATAAYEKQEQVELG
ncbi:MAG: Alanine--glyoxylate aminotransferase, partial [Gammaproteobacteria bacterium]|nr:Alanine--glyoxylate aminotransferase [Gammaproteobacteria bacterium]